MNVSEHRLAIPFALGGLVCLILAAVVSVTESPVRRSQAAIQRVSAEEARHRADKRAARLSATLQPALAAGNLRELQAQVALAAAVNPDIIEAGVVDADLTVLACSDPERAARPFSGNPALLRLLQTSLAAGPGPGGTQSAEDAAAQRMMMVVPLGKPQRLSTLYLVQTTAELEDDLNRQVVVQPPRVPVWLIIGLGLLGLGTALGMLWMAERRRALQVLRVQEGLDHIIQGQAQGQPAARLDPAEVPALSAVAERVNAVAEQVEVLQQAQAEGRRHASRIDEELHSAQIVQQTLMPDVRRIGRGALQLCGVYRSVSKLSGDWWHYYPLDEHRTLLVLADVLGHGIGAAVVGAMAYGCAAQLHQGLQDELRPEQLLHQLNHVIWATTRGKYTMSCFAAIIDTKECLLTYASGAHAFPLLFRARDTQKPFVPLVAAGAPLGSSEDPTFQQSTQGFGQGDLLICYTDGLIEASNAAGDPFGDKRVRQVVQRCYSRNVEEICEILLGEVSRFVGSAELDDDQTLVVARNLPLGSSSSSSSGSWLRNPLGTDPGSGGG